MDDKDDPAWRVIYRHVFKSYIELCEQLDRDLPGHEPATIYISSEDYNPLMQQVDRIYKYFLKHQLIA